MSYFFFFWVGARERCFHLLVYFLFVANQILQVKLWFFLVFNADYVITFQNLANKKHTRGLSTIVNRYSPLPALFSNKASVQHPRSGKNKSG